MALCLSKVSDQNTVLLGDRGQVHLLGVNNSVRILWDGGIALLV